MLAEEWRGLREELAPQLPEAERQALEDRAALEELEGYLNAGAELVEIDLAGLQDGGASAEQMLQRPWLESTVNEFESKFGLPSSQLRAMRPELLLEEEDAS